MLELKPDAARVIDRFEAWWHCEILDRPLASIHVPVPDADRRPLPAPAGVSLRDQWLDVGYQVDLADARLSNTIHMGDALPIVHPNLGPEVFSAFYGCPLSFGETTSWSDPILEAWEPERLALDRENVYFRKILELTDGLFERGRGRFLVGYTDLHPGADAIAAFRDPQRLAVDLIERPEEVRRLVDRVTEDFLEVYDLYHEKLRDAGMPSTTWLHAVSRGRMHVPSNDFSCMISERHFSEVFLSGLIRECRHMDRCIYHLDGPQALRLLDLLLEVPEIHAIQWVAGANRDYWADWIDVYRRIQDTGRALWLPVPLGDLDAVFGALRPQGVWLTVTGCEDRDSGERALTAVGRWRG